MAHSSIVGQSVTSEDCKARKDSIPEWILAKEGIKLIINDNGTEAEKLFLQYPNSLVMYAGYAFAVMMVSYQKMFIIYLKIKPLC